MKARIIVAVIMGLICIFSLWQIGSTIFYFVYELVAIIECGFGIIDVVGEAAWAIINLCIYGVIAMISYTITEYLVRVK